MEKFIMGKCNTQVSGICGTKVRNIFLTAAIVIGIGVVLLICISFFNSSPQKNALLITDEDFLSASGENIVNQKGKKIFLQGVNLGGWLLQEYWMCPVIGESSISQWTNLETLQVLEKRFGAEKAQKLVQCYEDNWITEWDIQRIAEMGCNVIRVPFWYRNFMSDPEGTWLAKTPDKNPGFQKLDWVIETAGKYGVYVILDMHGCPGGQSTDHCSGSARKCELFTNVQYQNAMEKLWTTIAERYKDNPVIAAYDIMNEAQAYEGDRNTDPRNILYDSMINAIRSVDSRHMITVQGIWTLSKLPTPEEAGWTNVVYQVHSYGIPDTEQYCRNLNEYGKSHNVPVYIGEFSDMNILKNCRDVNLHYTMWTYKGTIAADGTWYMYYSDKVEAVDLYNDSYEQIEEKWGEKLHTLYFDEVESVTRYWSTE